MYEMIFPIALFLVVYFFIATEMLDKTIAALIGAGLMIGLHLVSYEEALHAVDLNVLFLLIGMMVVVNTMTETGVFEWLAIKLARLARGNGLLIAIFFMVLTPSDADGSQTRRSPGPGRPGRASRP